MNNKYLASLLCITVLALAPACKCKKSYSAKATKDADAAHYEDVNTMIELDNSVFETEETIEIDETEKSVTKF